MAVVLHTTHGDLPVLLHFKECPRAAFNFLALCASGYYDGCSFYRHMPGILLQSGDPTNTGKGGESIFAKLSTSGDAESNSSNSRYFDDEGFGVTHHNARGVLAMAHKGTKANTNASQFFILLSGQSGFNGVYTSFGAVDLEGKYCSETRTVRDCTPDGEAEDATSAGGEDVLKALEAAAAQVDAKFLVEAKDTVRITGATVLYNPFAEGRMRL